MATCLLKVSQRRWEGIATTDDKIVEKPGLVVKPSEEETMRRIEMQTVAEGVLLPASSKVHKRHQAGTKLSCFEYAPLGWLRHAHNGCQGGKAFDSQPDRGCDLDAAERCHTAALGDARWSDDADLSACALKET